MPKILSLASMMLLAASLPAAWAADDAPAAGAARQARVAGGQVVTLADSAKTAAQWAERRPNYQALKPRKR